jgi:signal transduction histidine kinase
VNLEPEAARRRFRLLPWFAGTAICAIGITSVVSAVVTLEFLERHMLERDAAVTMQFIQSVSHINDSVPYFRGSAADRDHSQLAEFFEHVTSMPDVLRANVYGPGRQVIWSSDPALVGARTGANAELERALAGQPVFAALGAGEQPKVEHATLSGDARRFVEAYLPIWDEGREEVLGVVEIYKAPRALTEALARGRILAWTTAITGGVFLFASLFWIVRRGSRLIEAQQRRLVRAEALCTVGEMAAAVAHGLRNPLAAIRAAAELCLETRSPRYREEAARDVVAEVDRLVDWIRQLLVFSASESSTMVPVAFPDLVDRALLGLQQRLERARVVVLTDLDERLPAVYGDPSLVEQMLRSLITNALEAMPNGGELRVSVCRAGPAEVLLSVGDTGAGMPPVAVARAFEPFFTSKREGLGLGLVLVKRVAEQHGAAVELRSQEGAGTTVTVGFPGRTA